MDQDRNTKSAQRVFEVLELFAEHRIPLSLKEIAQACGYPTSSAAALLKSIARLGYLDYEKATRTYFPTMRLFEVGAWVEDQVFVEDGIRDQLERMSELTEETITLAARSDLHTRYVYAVQSQLPLSYRVDIGRTRLLAKSGLGWMLISEESDADIARLVRRMNARLDLNEPKIDLTALMRRIEEARRNGMIYQRNLIVEGAGGISFLLRQRFQGRALALGVHGPVGRLEGKLSAIIAEMKRYSAALG